ncbi:MAG TPA: hypothetical protein VIL22_07795 [Paenibacillaceae bacterium]
MRNILFACGIAAALILNPALPATSESPHGHDSHEAQAGDTSGGPKKAGEQVDPRDSRVKQERPRPSGGVVFSTEVLGLLGMDRAELRDRLADGQTLAQIAEERGVSRDALKKALTDAFNRRMEAKKERFAAHLDRLLDTRWPGRPRHHEKDKDGNKNKILLPFFGAAQDGAGIGTAGPLPGALYG